MFGKVIVPALAAPFIAGLVAACGTWIVYRLTRKVLKKRREEGFRWGQIATASLVALAHGTNDAQKTMGVIALALITTGHLTGDVKEDGLPFWVIASCALAIGLGTYIGGWRVIRTLGKGLVEIESPQGLAAEASSAAIILSRAPRAWRCRPPTSRPDPSSVAVSASPARRCAGRSRAGWPWRG